jgi:UMF1 family MFS transporter
MSVTSSYSRRAIWSWALFDFANSPFTTLVVTFLYSQYFVRVIASDPIQGTVLWSRGVTITALIVAFASPVLGALADRGGFRKKFLVLSSGLCIVGTVVLYDILPGHAIQALIWFVVANIGFEFAMVFYNAFLPDIAPADRIGRISGYGWALGYVGALLALVVALVTLIQPEVPWFGFSKENGESIRATNLLVAGWFALFSLPFMLWVKEDKSQVSTSGGLLSNSVAQLRESFHQIRQYRQIVRFLLARLLYNDGLVTIFAFAGIYAAGTFGFDTREILIFGIVLNVTSGLGAFVMGFVDDRIGGKITIQITLVGLSIATLIAVVAPNRFWFWVAGILVGIFVGPNQAASRSLMGRFVPPDKETEFFGFFAFSGKLTAFLGPFFFGVLTGLFNTQRAGISIVFILLAAGWIVLAKVDEKEGIRTAGR